VLRLSSLLGTEVRRGAGSLGRLVDLSVAIGAEGTPPIESAWVRRGRRETIGIRLVAGFELSGDAMLLAADTDEATANAGLLLARHVLDAQLIDLEEKRLVRVGDVLLSETGDGLRLAGVEIGVQPVLRRLGLGVIASHADSERIAWGDLHFTSTRADTLQLSVPRRAIRHLPVERIGARPGRRFGRVMWARRHAPR
jgi:magnesium transporter